MKSRSITFFIIGIMVCLAAPPAIARDTASDSAPRLAEALDALRASDSAWRRNDADYRAMRKADQVSESESRQFAEFVAEQRRFMLEDCQHVRELGGDPENLGFDCALPAGSGAAGSISRTGPASVQTEEEKDAALKRRLRDIEGELDDLFKTKQDELRSDPARQTQDASAGGGAGGGSGSGAGARVATEREPRENGDERAPVAGKRTEGLEPERGAGRGVEKPAEPPPGKVPPRADAPDGDGDDVVARQLREAAERETDPVMKEKLMEEYKKYKEATS